jgi:hypothetical protein
VTLAPLVRAGTAGATGSARQEHLDRHPVAGPDAPSSGRATADLFEDADGLVTGHERIAREEITGELLVIRATQPTSFDAEDAVVVTDLRDRNLTRNQLPRFLQDERASRRHSGLLDFCGETGYRSSHSALGNRLNRRRQSRDFRPFTTALRVCAPHGLRVQ